MPPPDDRARAAALAARNLRLAYAFVRRFGRVRGVDTEDLQQAACLALHQACLTWRPERGRLSVWAWRYMRAALVDLARAARRRAGERSAGDAIERLPADHSPRRPLAARARLLRARLDRLPEPHRTVVRLRLDGVPVRQAARAAGCGMKRLYRLIDESVRLLSTPLEDPPA